MRSHEGSNDMSIERINRIVLVGALLTLALPAWAQRGAGRNMQGGIGQGPCQTLIASVPKQALDATEAAELNYMREEEKLARDVYIKLYSKWATRIFGNISQSEQRHCDALKLLLDRYGLEDPAANKAVGVFQNSGLQTLYTDLVAQGEASLSAALRVGATIEDLDIRDLEKALAATDNNDLKIVYQNLQRGSRNHMQTFISQLEAQGESYAAQYISAATLAEILSSPFDAGMGYGGRRNGLRGMGRGNGICPWGRTP
jgi:hypothetical protein